MALLHKLAKAPDLACLRDAAPDVLRLQDFIYAAGNQAAGSDMQALVQVGVVSRCACTACHALMDTHALLDVLEKAHCCTLLTE